MGDIKRTLYQPTQVSTGPGPLDFGPRQPGALETAIGGSLKVAEKHVGNMAQLEANTNKLILLEQQEQLNTGLMRLTDDYVSVGDSENLKTNAEQLYESNFGTESPWYNADDPAHQELEIKTRSAIERMHNKTDSIAIDRNTKATTDGLDYTIKNSPNDLGELYDDWKSHFETDTSNMSPQELDDHNARGEKFSLNEAAIFRSVEDVSNHTDPKTGEPLISPSVVSQKLHDLQEQSDDFMVQRTVSESISGLPADKQLEVINQMLLDVNSGDAPVIYRNNEGEYVQGTSGANYSDSDVFNLTKRLKAAETNASGKAAEIESKRKEDAVLLRKSEGERIKRKNNESIELAGATVGAFPKSTRAFSIELLDKDTFVYKFADGLEHTMRFTYIDADEVSVEEGRTGKEKIIELLESGEAHIIHSGYGYYGRELGDVIVGGKRVSSIAIEQGNVAPFFGADALQPVYGKSGNSDLQKSLDLKKPKDAYKRTPANLKPVFPGEYPLVKNPDGTESNVKIGIFEFDGKHTAIPTMVGGKQLEDSEAVEVAKKQGLEKYPSFDTQKEAEAWAEENHSKINKDGTRSVSDKEVEAGERKSFLDNYAAAYKDALGSFEPDYTVLNSSHTESEKRAIVQQQYREFQKDLHTRMAGQLKDLPSDQYETFRDGFILTYFSDMPPNQRDALFKLYDGIRKIEEDELVANPSQYINRVYPWLHEEFTNKLSQIEADSSKSSDMKDQASWDANVRYMENVHDLARKHLPTDRAGEIGFLTPQVKRDMERRKSEGQRPSEIFEQVLLPLYESVSPNYKSAVYSAFQEFIPDFVDAPDDYNALLEKAIPGFLSLGNFSIFDVTEDDLDLYEESVSVELRFDRADFLLQLNESKFLSMIPIDEPQRESIKAAMALQAEAEAIKRQKKYGLKRITPGGTPSHKLDYQKQINDMDESYKSQYVQVKQMTNSVVSKASISALTNEGQRSWFDGSSESSGKIKFAERFIKMEPQLVNHILLPKGSYMTKEDVLGNSRLKFNSDAEGNIIVSLVDIISKSVINIEGENGSPLALEMNFEDFYYRYDTSAAARYKNISRPISGSGFSPQPFSPYRAEEIESVETAPAHTKGSRMLTYSNKRQRARKGIKDEDQFFGFYFNEVPAIFRHSGRYKIPAEFTDFFMPKDQFGEYIPLPLKSQLEKPRLDESDINFGVMGGDL